MYICTAEEGFRAETYCTVYHRFAATCVSALKEDTVEYNMLHSNEPVFYVACSQLSHLTRTCIYMHNKHRPLGVHALCDCVCACVSVCVCVRV